MGLFRIVVKEAWEKTFLFTKFLCFLHVTDNYLVDPVKIYGPSMLPVIDLNPSIFLAERITPRSGKVTHRDIVVFRSPQNPRRTVTKRVVGLEGDTITYVSNPENSDNDKHETVVVPKGHVWVQGDNKYNSTDSRHFGPIPYGLIESKIFWKVFPLDDFGSFWRK
ncbi:unnamed protein product [Lathyrus sativus]|nr:unnamed protein product [Lathyrus sativus]